MRHSPRSCPPRFTGMVHSTRRDAGCSRDCSPTARVSGGAKPRWCLMAATVVTGMPWVRAKWRTSRRRDMVPSSFVSSPMAATGGAIPASLHSVTDASVCPDRSLSRPSLAMRGNTWPGRLSSSGLVRADPRMRNVRARSEADTPVDTILESHVTVKAVWCLSLFSRTIRGRSRRSACSLSIGAHRIPLVYRIMSCMCDSPQALAAITRSPSFSRDASSITRTMRPLATASMTRFMSLSPNSSVSPASVVARLTVPGAGSYTARTS
mmetsp:Transcript_14096/g.40061  ORF Transcript_14096/g.40061 Transcript_14096/m.40061 type:complete len:266 (-) Transcript_14096:708-1505(-)